MKTDDITYLSATGAMNLFKKGILSPVEVLKAQINRISNLNNEVNCIPTNIFVRPWKMPKNLKRGIKIEIPVN